MVEAGGIVSDLFAKTHCVALELSNICQYAWLHKECPVHLEMASPFRVKRPRHLPGSIVRHVLDVLGEHGYASEINFHQYNEPLIDPRLFEFIRYARARCPDAKIVLVSNGGYLSRQLAEELREAGLSGIWVTPYGSQEDKAAVRDWITNEIEPVFPGMANYFRWRLDDRLCIYDRDEQVDRGNCYAPYSTIVITRDAEWALCCRDWKRTVTFGSLREQHFEDLLRSPEARQVYEALSHGDRSVLDVCRRCKSAIMPG
jgi:MoaA/NifB/PqqE/SkfB family radical SAM enzyme